MKLFLCKMCTDVQQFNRQRRTCSCGATWGELKKDHDSVLCSKEAVVIGVSNLVLMTAIVTRNRPDNLSKVDAWVFPDDYRKVERADK